ncbi:MAG: hypothetical protein JWM86_977, partial [Thermoleophilia bacterium]|nr:hypothetical protein [Thermoleophilia bacterium]
MKNVLLKFAGLFVERVPVDERGNPIPPNPSVPAPHGAMPPGAPRQPGGSPAAPNQPPQQPQHPGNQGHPQQHSPVVPTPGQPMQGAPMQGGPMVAPTGGQVAGPGAGAPISVALRAWVPQEYAAHLAPFGVHVIAAGGSVTSEQARGWGADVLVVSAECLGQDVHLLQQPQLPAAGMPSRPGT